MSLFGKGFTDPITRFPAEQSIAYKQVHIGAIGMLQAQNQAEKWQGKNLFTRLLPAG